MFPYLVCLCLFLFGLFFSFSDGIWPDNLTILKTYSPTNLIFPKVSSVKKLQIEVPCKCYDDVSNEEFNFTYLNFTNLENLEHLEFFRCPKLTSLPSNAFESAKKLKKLKLDQTHNLKTMDKDALKGLTELEVIDLSWNWFKELPKGFFGNAPKLQKIDISETLMR